MSGLSVWFILLSIFAHISCFTYTKQFFKLIKDNTCKQLASFQSYLDRALVSFHCSVNFPANCYQLSIIRDPFSPVAHAKETSDVCGFVKTEKKEQAVMYVKMLTLHIN